jgi:hypothetical protein
VKIEGGLMSDSELQGGSHPSELIKDCVSWAMLQQALSYVLTHMGYMGP